MRVDWWHGLLVCHWMEACVVITHSAWVVGASKDVESSGIVVDEVQELIMAPHDVVGDTDGVDDGIEALTRYSLQVWRAVGVVRHTSRS